MSANDPGRMTQSRFPPGQRAERNRQAQARYREGNAKRGPPLWPPLCVYRMVL